MNELAFHKEFMQRRLVVTSLITSISMYYRTSVSDPCYNELDEKIAIVL